MNDICLMKTDDLEVVYGSRQNRVYAVNGVSLVINTGESVALVGESGCGKTSLSRAVLGLEKISGGTVSFSGKSIEEFSKPAWKHYRQQVQMIFQDPAESLNPRQTIGSVLGEVLKVCRKLPLPERQAEVENLLKTVGLDPDMGSRYPHELSGGQKQRVGIARALAVCPQLIIADEPVSALDVSVQVQILNLLLDLQQERGLALLLIAHDLAVVRYMCSRIYVMYRGTVMEYGPADRIYGHAAHPYTHTLLAAVPDVARSLQKQELDELPPELQNDPPSPSEEISGCPFHPRCPHASDRCRKEKPLMEEKDAGQFFACHFPL